MCHRPLAHLSELAAVSGLSAGHPDRRHRRPRPAPPGQFPPRSAVPWSIASPNPLNRITWSRDDVRRFLGAYLTEPKAHIFFDSPDEPLEHETSSMPAPRGSPSTPGASLFTEASFPERGTGPPVEPAIRPSCRIRRPPPARLHRRPVRRRHRVCSTTGTADLLVSDDLMD